MKQRNLMVAPTSPPRPSAPDCRCMRATYTRTSAPQEASTSTRRMCVARSTPSSVRPVGCGALSVLLRSISGLCMCTGCTCQPSIDSARSTVIVPHPSTPGDGGNVEGLYKTFIDTQPQQAYCANTSLYQARPAGHPHRMHPSQLVPTRLTQSPLAIPPAGASHSQSGTPTVRAGSPGLPPGLPIPHLQLPAYQPIPGEQPVITLQDGQFCPSSQPAWSAYREPTFGHGALCCAERGGSDACKRRQQTHHGALAACRACAMKHHSTTAGSSGSMQAVSPLPTLCPRCAHAVPTLCPCCAMQAFWSL